MMLLLLVTFLFQPWQTASSQDTDRVVCISARTARLVLIDLKAFDRARVKMGVLESIIIVKDSIHTVNIKRIDALTVTNKEWEIKSDLWEGAYIELGEDTQKLSKQLKRSKKSKLWVGAGGLIIGIVLGVVIAK